MKQTLRIFKRLYVMLMLVFVTTLSFGQAGFNSTFIVLNSNNLGNVYYDLQASTGNPDFNNANLGAFCEGSSTLIFKGAEHNNYKCGGCDITSTRLMYRIYTTGSPSGVFINNPIDYSSGFANGCSGQDQQWSNLSYNTNLLSGLGSGNYTLEVYSEQSTTCLGTVYASNDGANYKANFTVNTNVTYYLDADNDGFGTSSVSQVSCFGTPVGYVTNNLDCNDSQLQYLDTDGDGYGSLTLVACGVTNNLDCNDNQLQYLDADGDGFGTNILVACGVVNNFDCNDNQLQYQDADGDGFGHLSILVACGLANNIDSNDNQINYVDNDNDGFGQNVYAPSGPTNNFDCNDNQLQYQDADGDGFGHPTILVACGLANNIDSNDNQVTYVDNDNDGFGQNTYAPFGPTNNFDCNDNQLQYLDADGDGFGHPTVLVACGLPNNIDSNDNLVNYVDNDSDGFGQNVYAPSGPINNFDCNDNQLQYQDADGDGFGHPTVLVACGLANNIDSNDNLVTYVDNDSDGFGQNVYAPSGPTNNFDCNDNQLQYQDADGDGFGHPTVLVACGLANNIDSNDNLVTYVDNDSDGFGQNVYAPSGPTNNFDCNDNQLQYQDADGDGFGHPTVLVACGLANNIDSNDNLVTYVDNDSDGFGQNVYASSGPTNNFDCNDNQLQYLDADGDGFGHPTILVACGGVTNNTDCNDNDFYNLTGIIYYQDADGDGYGNALVTTSACSQPVGYVSNNSDCNDNVASINPGAVDVCYDGIDNDCNGIIDNVGLPGGCTPIVSTMPVAQCGTTVSGLSTSMYATNISGAQGYRFKVTNMSTMAVQVIDRPVNNLAFSAIPGVTYNTQYQVEIGVKYNNVWQPFYGSPCFINTPNPVSTPGAQCGTTLSAMNQWVYTTYVANVTAYRFKVTNLTTSEEQVFTTSSYKFNFTQLSSRAYNTTYSVEVSLRNTNGVFMPYNAGCNVTTPSFPESSIRDSQCDYTALSTTEMIAAVLVPTATVYRFFIYNNALEYQATIDRSLNTFNLNMFTGLTPGATYSVQVSVKIGEEFGPYGKVCSLTVPGLAKEQTIAKNIVDFKAVAYPNPFAENFKLDVNTSSEEVIKVSVYDMIGKQVEQRQINVSDVASFEVGSGYPSGVYNVIVTQGENTQTLRVIKR